MRAENREPKKDEVSSHYSLLSFLNILYSQFSYLLPTTF
jgi:hypothetical protein